ncbi:hypothetical protein KC957_01735, partial [Candidatus Saccharibacteria bacterium]|nr:hypothetical protein [Candidatus Saccharibacteria bacterium]
FFSGTTSQVRLKDNVVNGGSNVTTHGDLSLGGHNSSSSEWNNLDLCEIAIYSGTGTTDPEGVMAHFKAKYGLT